MKTKKIRIIHPVPSFISPVSYQKIPPLDKGETITLPAKVADLLIRKKRAKEIIVEQPFEKWEQTIKKEIVNAQNEVKHV